MLQLCLEKRSSSKQHAAIIESVFSFGINLSCEPEEKMRIKKAMTEARQNPINDISKCFQE